MPPGPAPGPEWTDHGSSRETCGLKHRTTSENPQHPPPAPVQLLRAHIHRYGTGPAGACFAPPAAAGRTTPAAPRPAGIPASPPAGSTPCAVSLWLNVGVLVTEVARRAGHDVAVLLRVYLKCIDGRAGPASASTTTTTGHDDVLGRVSAAPVDGHEDAAVRSPGVRGAVRLFTSSGSLFCEIGRRGSRSLEASSRQRPWTSGSPGGERTHRTAKPIPVLGAAAVAVGSADVSAVPQLGQAGGGCCSGPRVGQDARPPGQGPRACAVAGPTIPSADRPCRDWKLITCAWVTGPNTPSGSAPVFFWTTVMSSPSMKGDARRRSR